MSHTIAFLFALFIALISATPTCTPGTLNSQAINQLPSSGDFSLSFTDYDLIMSANIVQTDPARDTFTFTFHNAGGEDCPVDNANLLIGAEPASGPCIVAVSNKFTWPPTKNCFVKTSDASTDKFTSTLVLSWLEHFTINGIPYARTVSVDVPVEVDIPKTVEFTSNFVSSSTSTASFISAFLISSASVGVPINNNVPFVFDIPTITSKDGAKVLQVATLVPQTGGTVTQQGTGAASDVYWQQTWEWDISESCSALSNGAQFTFRATFSCQTEGANGCHSSDYDGQFQDIVLTVTAAALCPTVVDTSLTVTGTIEMINQLDQVTTYFSDQDSISARISSITDENNLVSAVITSVKVNDLPWQADDQYTVDTGVTDLVHPVIHFDTTSSLLGNGLTNSPSTPNIIKITLSLTWKTGQVTKRSMARATTNVPFTSASQNFTIASEPEASAGSFTAPAYGFIGALALFFASLL